MLADDLKGSLSSQQIAEAIARAVSNGELTHGDPLPSIRNIADTCGVSPGTAALAYRSLRERGIITSGHGRRSRVADRPPLPRQVRLPLPPGVHDLSTSSPDPGLLPDVGGFLSREVYGDTLYDTEPVEASFRTVMAAQFAADGIHGELSAVNGALDGLERVLAARLRPGDAVLVEDPQWVSSLALFRVLGLEVVPVAVDERGMRPEALAEAIRSRHCSAIVVTPRAQNPYGSAFTTERAEDLRRVLATAPELMVIEDDHASLIAGAPPTTLTTGREQWAVIRSMSKALGPDLRVAIMASDDETADRVQGRLMLGPGWVSHLAQRLVATVLNDPGARQQVAEAERTYTRRREALVSGLAEHGIPSTGRSGLNVLVPVPEESALASYLLTQGWAVRSGESFRLRSEPFLRVAVATLTEEEAPELAAAFARALPGRRARSRAY
ncbi:aminotransferase class I/II-fold pyridoxal phosphate-dependent enzyme [Actinotalea sp. BY-33]|uniref:Aminotransferase class I/II-fold pyridoxal phosphate-dependent enzyme n=1 Tax=Actinotalea soli TaxID=2819234 RepID=A0A939RSG0_9CELL|nr:aminotransferase class I/II-fold pyridoxal phosphate-dependent enzyme [Actinotalea soli]MBO1751117.1 aminotransferase class I/II-fold pyridoxal phosphate-dependent enzyme [Actinotalea soli]